MCESLMCERVIDHGLGTMKLNANYTYYLETWNIQGQGHKVHDGKNSSRSIYIWSVKELLTMV